MIDLKSCLKCNKSPNLVTLTTIDVGQKSGKYIFRFRLLFGVLDFNFLRLVLIRKVFVKNF